MLLAASVAAAAAITECGASGEASFEMQEMGGWTDAWKQTCHDSWSTEQGWAASDHPVEAAQRAHQLLDAYESLKAGSSHVEIPAAEPELLDLLTVCGFSVTPSGHALNRVSFPADSAERTDWIEAHERAKNTARQEHHQIAAAARKDFWAALLLQQASCGSLQCYTELEAAKLAMQQLLECFFEPASNLGFHSLLRGVHLWLTAQQSESCTITWRVEDTAVTELGDRELVTAVAHACGGFSTAQVCEDGWHEWSVHPEVSNGRLAAMLELIPAKSQLGTDSCCGELVTTDAQRTNVDGQRDQAQSWYLAPCVHSGIPFDSLQLTESPARAVLCSESESACWCRGHTDMMKNEMLQREKLREKKMRARSQR